MIPALQIENVSKSFRGPSGAVKALDSVSLVLGSGEFVALQGPSGCGKTTLVLVGGALLRPDGGRVLLDGRDPCALSSERRAQFRARNLAFVFQELHLIPYLSVLDNVLAPSLAFPAQDARERALELVSHFGLKQRADHPSANLSTGERQRAAFARALLNRPKLLLVDELTGNLDEENAEIILHYLADFSRGGAAVLLVTHDSRAAQLAGRVVKMANGKIDAS